MARVGFVGWTVIGLLGAVWLLGYICAPSRNATLASVMLGPTVAFPILSGRAFSCTPLREPGRTRCSAAVQSGTLTIELGRGSCSAALGSRTLSCRYGGYRSGYPSLMVDAPDLRLPRLSLWAPLHFLGSLTECAWTNIAKLTALLLPLAIGCVRAARAEPLKRRLGFRLLLAVVAMPPLLLVLLVTLMTWGYLD